MGGCQGVSLWGSLFSAISDFSQTVTQAVRLLFAVSQHETWVQAQPVRRHL